MNWKCALSLLIGSFGLGQIATADMFGVNAFGFVFRIDTENGSGELIGNSGFGATLGSAYVNGEYLFAMGSSPFICKMDPKTGAMTPTTIPLPSGPITALSHGPRGTLLAIRDASPSDELLMYDSFNGWVTRGSTGFQNIEGLAYHPSNTIYAWDTVAGLVHLSVFNGFGIDVNPSVGAPVTIRSLEVSYDGRIFGAWNELYQVSGAGVPTLVGIGAYGDIRALASDPTIALVHDTAGRTDRISRVDGTITPIGTGSANAYYGSAYYSQIAASTPFPDRFVATGVTTTIGQCLYTIDPGTGSSPWWVPAIVPPVFSSNTPTILTGLAWRYDTLWAVGLQDGFATYLYRYSPASGWGRLHISPPSGVQVKGLACDEGFNLYGNHAGVGLFRFKRPPNGVWYIEDVNPNYKGPAMEALDFAPDGTLFGMALVSSAGTYFSKIDPTTGFVTPIGPLLPNVYSGLTFGRKTYDTNPTTAQTSAISAGSLAGLAIDGDNSSLTLTSGSGPVGGQAPVFIETTLPVVGHNPSKLVLRYHRVASTTNLRETVKIWNPGLNAWVSLAATGNVPTTKQGVFFLLSAENIYPNFPSVTVRIEYGNDRTGSGPWSVTLDRCDLEYIP